MLEDAAVVGVGLGSPLPAVATPVVETITAVEESEPELVAPSAAVGASTAGADDRDTPVTPSESPVAGDWLKLGAAVATSAAPGEGVPETVSDGAAIWVCGATIEVSNEVGASVDCTSGDEVALIDVLAELLLATVESALEIEDRETEAAVSLVLGGVAPGATVVLATVVLASALVVAGSEELGSAVVALPDDVPAGEAEVASAGAGVCPAVASVAVTAGVCPVVGSVAVAAEDGWSVPAADDEVAPAGA